MDQETRTDGLFFEEDIDFVAALLSKFACSIDKRLSDEAAFLAIRDFIEKNNLSVETVDALANQVKLACTPQKSEAVH